MGIALTSVWNFLKAHWQVLLLVVIVVVGYAWFERQQSRFAQTLDDMNKTHQIELDTINKARTVEDQQHASELKQLQDSVAKIQSDYAAAQQQLQVQQKQEVQQIVTKYGNDADGLAGLLADKMGFTVVKPTAQ